MSELTAMEFLKRRREICRSFDHRGTCPIYLTCWNVEDLSDEALEEQIKIVSEWLSNQPFIPKAGETHWSVTIDSEPGYVLILENRYFGGVLGKLMAVNGFCYRTEAAAQAHAEEDLARLQALYDDRVKRQENE